MRAVISKQRKRLSVVGALMGLALGLAMFGLLAGVALFKTSPGGPDENRMWFGLFATIMGRPLAALRDAVMPGLSRGLASVVATLILNWLMVGFAVGGMIDLARRAKGVTHS